MNDGGEFPKAFLEIYPAELELKVENNGNHATFLDLDISIDKGKFIYKMFEKQDAFNFHILKMSSITSNTPSIIFYSFTISEFARISKTTLKKLFACSKKSIRLNDQARQLQQIKAALK